MKNCRICQDEITGAGHLICQECAAALDQMVTRKTDENGFDYIEVDNADCAECEYFSKSKYEDPCITCHHNCDISRDYFKPKEAGK